MNSISIKLGVRNLARNRWRSGLTLAAIAVAVGLMVWTLALYEGWLAQMVRGATAVETAQIQIHTAGYVESPRSWYAFPAPDTLLETIRHVPGVVALSPRVRAFGLLGNERRSQVVQLVGVDPDAERATTPVADGMQAGRWLGETAPDYPAPRELVLGAGVARQLQVKTGDELVAFVEAADGSLGNELFVVTGIVRTGNTAIDRQTVYMRLPDAQYLSALDGEVHEIAIATADLTAARTIADSVGRAIGAPVIRTAQADSLPPDQVVVRPWQTIMPAIDQMIVLFRRSYAIMYVLIYLVAAVGILNTQRMSALERRREFGVMMAIGMRPRRMFRQLQVETLVLGLAGAVIGVGLGGALAWYHASAGFDMSALADSASFTYMGVAFTDRLYFQLRPFMFWQPVVVMLGVAFLCGLLPAWKAARIDLAPTISGRQ